MGLPWRVDPGLSRHRNEKPFLHESPMLGSNLMLAPIACQCVETLHQRFGQKVLAVEHGESGGIIMENNTSNKYAALNPEAQTAKAAIVAECDRLAAAGVTFVAVHFDG
jgi:hypothetical protein